MVSLFIEKPLDFSSFPSLILFTTILRLALEVATARLILSHGFEGTYAAGHVVAAFGSLLMGGDLFIGSIIFIIILIVNFMVITKGSSRIAEVAARFSLDAMPGKQMAIDAELSSGAINDEVARSRRRHLEEESAFFGTMDGAAKFVRGDAIAGIIIAVVNICGGLIIGLVRHNMSLFEALNTFSTLAVGDGLIAQIPALLVSTAAGIVVTKGAGTERTDVVLSRQLTSEKKPILITSIICLIFSFIPGLPSWIFFLISFFCISILLFRHYKNNKHGEFTLNVSSSIPESKVDGCERVIVPTIDPLKIELGSSLLAVMNSESSRLTSKIKTIRQLLANDMGFILPSVRIQDNLSLPAEAYSIKVRDIEVASGRVKPNGLLSMDPKGGIPKISGEETVDPAFGIKALWIDPRDREVALMEGYTVVDSIGVIVTHLSESIKNNISDLFSYHDADKIISSCSEEDMKIISNIIPNIISVGTVHRILQSILSENISIRDISVILEAIQEASTLGLKLVPEIVAHVRLRLSRQISAKFSNEKGEISAILLGGLWSSVFLNASRGGGIGGIAAQELNKFLNEIRGVINQSFSHGPVVIIVDPEIRLSVKSVMERLKPIIYVLSFAEISQNVKINVVARLG